MTFASYEQSNDDGAPVSFYHFRWGQTVWTYCNAPAPITLDGLEYTPIAAAESALRQDGDAPEFTLSVPRTLPVVDLFRGSPPSNKVWLTIRTMHPDDPDGEAKYRWQGPIANVRPDKASAEIVSRINGLRNGGLRLTYGRGCRFALFGPGCHVVKSLYATTRTITAVDGNAITFDADTPSDGYFNGGLLEWDADGLGTIESRTIERETATDTVRLYGRGDGLTVGQAVTLYPGCAHNADHCENKFDNLANYPGRDFMLGRTPFEGRALL